ncbi:MAG: 2Fe-2S iron-sulfur cluster-binding protein [Geminocystis sp.]|nr:2Fe-2S iron-sulfur cluster-binding protein [Geminocystis sp.]HIK38093.1 2Fe-2S iron-sulfur cluster binding domain-containing protein [Geminocystis sp. M7585_C2015_104]MCS7149049.1 2Fe-2S iron-sulfur cluster-binding protein [Geminocystis sp.]MCX8077758.1 2Fe-2S iron-sulfur cluster-binding protein [Geminocystis sp.]MDW8117126.1 2Fe-2S iron-sulfur cluster-binding protein [Geminocystis sp.]
MSVRVTFQPDNVTVSAESGESILAVAKRAGIFIPTGCLMGSCHACEVELEDGTPICACISAIPVDSEELTIYLYGDPVW